MEPVTVPLSAPIEREGAEPVTEVTFRDPLVEDYLIAGVATGPVAREAELIRLCIGLDQARYRKMRYADYLRLVRTLGNFSRTSAGTTPT